MPLGVPHYVTLMLLTLLEKPTCPAQCTLVNKVRYLSDELIQSLSKAPDKV